MKDFTKKLAQFFKEELRADDNFCKEMEECEDFYEIRDCLEGSCELKKLMGVDDLQDDIDELQDEVSELETSVEQLEATICELEGELDNKIFKPNTYWDEEKYELFLRHHEKFTPSQFEDLLNKNP